MTDLKPVLTIKDFVVDNLKYYYETVLETDINDKEKEFVNKLLNLYNTKPVDTNKNKFTSLLDKMTNDKYKTTWARLTHEQKIFKLKEYFENNNISKSDRKIITINFNKDNLISKDVDYNKIKGCIDSINIDKFVK